MQIIDDIINNTTKFLGHLLVNISKMQDCIFLFLFVIVQLYSYIQIIILY